MSAIYILIIASTLSGPAAIQTHEYSSLSTCQQAAAWYTSIDAHYGAGEVHIFASCLSKGQKSTGYPQYVFTILPALSGGTLVSQDFNSYSACAAAYSYFISNSREFMAQLLGEIILEQDFCTTT